MARNSSDAVPEVKPELTVARDEARVKLLERVAKGREILEREIRTMPELEQAKADHSKWRSYNVELLKRLFTTDGPAEEFSRFYGGVRRVNPSPQELLESHKESVADGIHRLDSIIERIELIPEPLKAPQPSQTHRTSELNNKVFVVHGHDEAAKEAVARYLEKLGLEAVILHEKASGGKTVIEKLEHYADVAFAVVLLTPDDVGAAKAQSDHLRPRARQNVVLELGLFIGLLGRASVCALHRGSVELPSDFGGVVYVSLDDGAWRVLLARELSEAGFSVDMNRALK